MSEGCAGARRALGCRWRQPVATLVVSVGVLALGALPASAIECRGEYQVVSGKLIATPYCQDNYLAHVARKYGTKVSNREIRNNPNRKADVCRFMGHDSRVSHLCDQYRDGLPGLGR